MILFYAAEKNHVVQKLEEQTAQYTVFRCRSFETMTRRLRTPNHGLEVMVVVVSRTDEMEQLSNLRNLFRDLRLVVVLPNRDDEIVAWAHTLGPRFIAYADNGYEQVGAVLGRMIQASGHLSKTTELLETGV